MSLSLDESRFTVEHEPNNLSALRDTSVQRAALLILSSLADRLNINLNPSRQKKNKLQSRRFFLYEAVNKIFPGLSFCFLVFNFFLLTRDELLRDEFLIFTAWEKQTQQSRGNLIFLMGLVLVLVLNANVFLCGFSRRDLNINYTARWVVVGLKMYSILTWKSRVNVVINRNDTS